jgi:Ser/Thr protein kinase RdoA (MazF antagonist)
LIHGEVDWINHLARGGVSVAKAIPSESGKLVEVIEDRQGGQFLVTAFVKAEGRNPWDAGWTPARFETYGQLLGKMHALAVNYQPVPDWKRPEWMTLACSSSRCICLPPRPCAPKMGPAEHIHGLPRTASYGLIHQDAHQNNFFMDSDGRLTLFDFDDCAYSWFINDIAIVLFYISMDAADLGFATVEAFTQEFMTHFLRGYRQAYSLDEDWLNEIPNFLKLRELELYAVVHRDFDIRGIDHGSFEAFKRIPGFDIHNDDHLWIANFMRDRKTRIERGLPFIDFDFEGL